MKSRFLLLSVIVVSTLFFSTGARSAAQTDQSKRQLTQGSTAKSVPVRSLAIVDSTEFYKRGTGIRGLEDAQHQERFKDLVDQVTKALGRFSRLNGVQTLLDVAQVDGIVSVNASFDITRAFIDFYNSGESRSSRLILPDAKVALINTDSCLNEKTGITVLVAAVKRVDSEFTKELADMKARWDSLTEQQKESLRNEHLKKLQDAEAAYQKRYKEVVDPISDDIAKKLDSYPQRFILDTAKLPGLIFANESLDITQRFIDSYNSGKFSPSNLILPEAKIALTNTDNFLNEKTGITALVAAAKRLESEFAPRRKELADMKARLNTLTGKQKESLGNEYQKKSQDGEAELKKRLQELMGPIYDDIKKNLDDYAKRMGLNIVFDSSKISFVVADAIDLTSGFIADYNQHHR